MADLRHWLDGEPIADMNASGGMKHWLDGEPVVSLAPPSGQLSRAVADDVSASDRSIQQGSASVADTVTAQDVPVIEYQGGGDLFLGVCDTSAVTDSVDRDCRSVSYSSLAIDPVAVTENVARLVSISRPVGDTIRVVGQVGRQLARTVIAVSDAILYHHGCGGTGGIWSQDFSEGQPLYPTVPDENWFSNDPYQDTGFDGAGTGQSGSGTSISWSYTVPNADDMLIVRVGFGGVATTISDVTYNGVSLTRGDYAETGNRGVGIWYMASPPTGAHDVVVTANGATTILCGYARCLTGTALSEPVVKSSNNHSVTTPSPESLALSWELGCVTFSAVLNESTKILSPGSGVTSEYSAASGAYVFGSAYTGSSGTVTYVWSSGDVALSHAILAFKRRPTGPSIYPDLRLGDAADVGIGIGVGGANGVWAVGDGLGAGYDFAGMGWNLNGGAPIPEDQRDIQWCEFDLRVTEQALSDNSNGHTPWMWIGHDTGVIHEMLGVMLDHGYQPGPHVFLFETWIADDDSPNPHCTWTQQEVGTAIYDSDLLGDTHVRIEFKCGTTAYPGPIVNDDGYMRLYWDGVLKCSWENIRLVLPIDGDLGEEVVNRPTVVQFGWDGLEGIYSSIWYGWGPGGPPVSGSLSAAVYEEIAAEQSRRSGGRWAPGPLPPPLIPIAYVIVNSRETDGPITPCYWGDRAVAMHQFFVDPRTEIGPITRSLSDWQGRMEAASFEFDVNDYDALLAELLETPTAPCLAKREAILYLTFDNWWRADIPPLVIMRGIIGRVETLPQRFVRFSGDDYLTAEYVQGDETGPAVLGVLPFRGWPSAACRVLDNVVVGGLRSAEVMSTCSVTDSVVIGNLRSAASACNVTDDVDAVVQDA